MPRQDIVDYIEKELAKGFHIEDIKRALLSVGHDVQVVEEAVLHVHNKRDKAKRVGQIMMIVIPVIIIILIVAAVLYLKDTSPPVYNPIDTIDTTTANQQNAAQDNTDAGQTAVVEEQQPDLGSDQQLLEQALSSLDETKCSGIQDETMRNSCTLALTHDNASEQQSAMSAEDQQAFDAALSAGDQAKCEAIVDAAAKESCVKAIAPPPESSSESQPTVSEEDIRKLELALAAGNVSMCSAIQDATLKQQCNNALI